MAESLTYVPLKRRALVAVSGQDWRDFLQGLLTQDVETLQSGEARFAALLTPQGKVLYDLFLIGREDGVWLDVEAATRDALIQRLSIYRLRAKVEIGPIEDGVFAIFTALPDASRDPGGGSAWARAFAGVSGVWVVDPRLDALGWRGYGAASPPGATTADETAYEAHRLALGVPGPADWGSEATYPIEANFDLLHGVDFKKGCFVGQETTSRMKRRGQIKSRMLPLAFDGAPPSPGAEVLAGDLRAGEVLSGVPGRAMALVRLDRARGAALTLEGRPAKLVPPPWFEAALDPA